MHADAMKCHIEEASAAESLSKPFDTAIAARLVINSMLEQSK